jgi:hypothetical protein
MTSDRQRDANRRNAQRSTGPRTIEGRQRSSQNAVRHGVLSTVVTASHEDGEAFATLVDRLHEHHRPGSVTEEALVDRLALLFWRERRLAHTEATEADIPYRRIAPDFAAAEQYGVPRPDDPASLRALAGVQPIERQLLYGRYQTMLSNQISQTLAELRREQDLRINALDAAPRTD